MEKFKNSFFYNKKILTLDSDSLINQFTNILFEKYNRSSRLKEFSKLALNNILSNLIISHNNERYLIISKRANDYSGYKSYGLDHYTYKLIVNWIDILMREGYIEQKPGFYNTITKSGQRTRLWLTEKFILSLIEVSNNNQIFDSISYKKNVILKDSSPDKNLMDYKPTARIVERINFLNLYNELISSSKIILPIDYELLNEVNTKSSFIEEYMNIYNVIVSQVLWSSKSVVRYRSNSSIPYMITEDINYVLNKKLQGQLYSVYNNGKFSEGGRFYGATYQGLSKKDRAKILINDSPIVEIDYNALHINMLYNKIGRYFDSDPYSSVSNIPEIRPILKKVSLIAINSENKEQALRAIRSGINKDSKLIRLKQTYHLDEKDLLTKFESTHSQISNYFYSGIGTRLQNSDSQIAESILKHFTNRGIPCLCVHDSFIVPEYCQDELKEVMLKSYKNKFGFQCKVKIEGGRNEKQN